MLEDRLQYFDENKVLRVPGRNGLQTKEGPAAVQEAIDFLAGVQPLPAFSWRSGMAHACADHVKDKGELG